MSPAPPIAVVMLLPGCNMTCNFCITDNTFDTMTFPQASRLLDDLRSQGVGNVVLGGGEPLAWPSDVFRLAREAKQRGFFVQLGTNGIRLPRDFARRREIDRYVLPLESMEAHTHNRMRRSRKPHHEMIRDHLEQLRRRVKEVTISTVVTRMNLWHLTGIAHYLVDYQRRGGSLHAWHLYCFIPEGRGGAPNAPSLAIDAGQYRTACRWARAAAPELTLYERLHMFRSRQVGFYWFARGRLSQVQPQGEWCETAHPLFRSYRGGL